MGDYICDRVAVSEEDIFNYLVLNVLVREDVHENARREVRNNVSKLTRYGDSRIQIVKYFGDHFRFCGDCKKIYYRIIDGLNSFSNIEKICELISLK